jgi:transcriptional regulator with XRE-family HTH domain
MMEKTCPLTILKVQRGLNRRELSTKTGLGYESLARIERGQHNNISDHFAQTLGDFFQVDAAMLQEKYAQWRESLVENE